MEHQELFPTHVGMNRGQIFCHGTRVAVPHTRGDEPSIVTGYKAVDACSPHTWG